MIETTSEPIDPGKIFNRVSYDKSGSVVIHFGIVKPVVDERKTCGIEFTVQGDLEGELKEIEQYMRDKYKINDFLIVRRLGKLTIGDIIIAAAVAAENKASAFEACNETIDRCKKLKCLHKKELFEDDDK